MPFHFLMQTNGLLAHGLIKFNGRHNGLLGALFAPAHLYQGNQVRRVKGMPQKYSLRMYSVYLKIRDRNTAGTACQNYRGIGGGIQLFEKFLLNLNPLRSVFLYKLRVFDSRDRIFAEF